MQSKVAMQLAVPWRLTSTAMIGAQVLDAQSSLNA
jgi:hypothetical protein